MELGLGTSHRDILDRHAHWLHTKTQTKAEEEGVREKKGKGIGKLGTGISLAMYSWGGNLCCNAFSSSSSGGLTNYAASLRFA